MDQCKLLLGTIPGRLKLAYFPSGNPLLVTPQLKEDKKKRKFMAQAAYLHFDLKKWQPVKIKHREKPKSPLVAGEIA